MNRFVRTTVALAVLTAGIASRPILAQDATPLPNRVLEEPEPTPEDETPPTTDPPRPSDSSLSRSLSQSGMGNSLGAGPPGYDAFWFPSQSVAGQPTQLGFVRQGVSGGVPLWRNGGDLLLANVGVRHTLFFTDALLPDSREPFPEQLWNLNLGMSYLRRFDNGWSLGLLTTLGSASDRPFHSLDETAATVGAFVRMPARNQRDTWTFSLLYQSAGPVNFPLPMVAYGWNPSEQLRVKFGLPFSLFWQPTEAVSVNLSYVPLLNIVARVNYQLVPRARLYGGYEYLNESYFLADRSNDRDRFFVLEQRLIAGLQWDVWTHATVEVNGGYSFGREYGQGVSQWGTLRDRVDVEPGPFAGFSCRLRF